MAMSSRVGLALGVLVACMLAGTANAKTVKVVDWTFHVNATSVPRVNVRCGDSVVFSVPAKSTHSVVRVSVKSSSEKNFTKVCSSKRVKAEFPVKTVTKATNYTITYTKAGTYFYICGVGQHCLAGKMAVAVVVTCPQKASPPPRKLSPPPMATMPPMVMSPPPATMPPMAMSPPPAGNTITQKWDFGVGPTTIQAKCGDSVVFQATNGFHDVVEVKGNSCAGASDTTLQIGQPIVPMTNGGFTSAPVPLTTAGQRTFVCTVGNGGHCQGGMIVTYNVVC